MPLYLLHHSGCCINWCTKIYDITVLFLLQHLMSANARQFYIAIILIGCSRNICKPSLSGSITKALMLQVYSNEFIESHFPALMCNASGPAVDHHYVYQLITIHIFR